MELIRRNRYKIIPIILLATIFIWYGFGPARFLFAGEDLEKDIGELIQEINQEIQAREERIESLKTQARDYQRKIEEKQREALTLENQLSILKDRIRKQELEIERKLTEIESLSSEIRGVGLEITEIEAKISQLKERIAELIRLIHRYDRKTRLEILLLNRTLADFFDYLKYSENIQNGLQKVLNDLQFVKEYLKNYRIDLEAKRANLEELKLDLEEEKTQYQEQRAFKRTLLEETKGAEENFQELLKEAQREWQEAEADIVRLEKEIRERLAEEDEKGGWTAAGKLILSWSVPRNKITSYFHDPEYPYRSWIGEHTGIDIRASQGTPIEAASSGFVARTKDAGMGYSYIMLIHSNNISTVYGHVSKIYVKEGSYVKRGQVIGTTGGTPGTQGAGRFVTGPHLHFEVRVKGVPVTPLDYLL